MDRRLGFLGLGAVMLLGVLMARTANSCPFCTAVAQTFSEEFATVDAIVIAQLDATATAVGRDTRPNSTPTLGHVHNYRDLEG